MTDEPDTRLDTAPTPGDDRRTTVLGTGRRRLAALVAAVVLVAVAVIAVVLGTRDGDSDSASASDTTTTTATPTESAPTTEPAPAEPGEPAPGESVAPEGLGPEDQAPPTLAPVALDREVAVGAITGSVSMVEEIDGTSNAGIGNVNGPALRVTVRLVNAGPDELDLSAVAVNLFHGADNRPASPLQDRSQSPFAGSLPAGDAAEGVYVFTVPVDRRDQISVEVAVAPGADVIVFTGAV